MKKMFFLMLVAFSFLTFGCSDDGKSPFGEYQVSNIQGIDFTSLKQEDVLVRYNDDFVITKTCFYGLKNNKIWLAIFSKETKTLLVEYCFENEIPQNLLFPYGDTFEVADWDLDVYECGDLIVVEGIYSNVELNDGYSYSSENICGFKAPVFLNNEYISLVNGIIYPFWFDNSHILVVDDGYLLVKSDGNTLLLKDAPVQEEIPLTYKLAFRYVSYNLFFHDLYLSNEIHIEVKELYDFLKNGETDWEHIAFLPCSVDNNDEVEIVCYVTFKTGIKKEFLMKVTLSDKTYVWEESN